MRGTGQQGERECVSRPRLQSQLSTSRHLIHSLAFCLHRSDVAEDAQKCERLSGDSHRSVRTIDNCCVNGTPFFHIALMQDISDFRRP